MIVKVTSPCSCYDRQIIYHDSFTGCNTDCEIEYCTCTYDGSLMEDSDDIDGYDGKDFWQYTYDE